MDNHATTALDPRVLEAMLPYLREDFGNAASRNHAFGWRAEAAVEQARAQVAALIGAQPNEIVFTSGATESDNLALKGVAEFYRSKGDHIITLKTEHKAILDSGKRLERMRQERLEELKLLRLMELTGGEVKPEDVDALAAQYKLDQDPVLQRWNTVIHPGARVTYLDVEKDGRVSLEKLAAAITDRTILVSVMLANNEIGTVQPHRRDRQAVPGARGALPHRRGAGRGEGPVRRGVDEGRPGLGHRAQDLRPQGHRRALRAPQAAGAHRADHRRRRTRARHALRHPERGGHRGLRQGGGDRPDRDGGRVGTHPCAPRPAAGEAHGRAGHVHGERLARAPAARAT